MIMIFSSCSAKKNDHTQINPSGPLATPSYYLEDKHSILALERTRESIFRNEAAMVGSRKTYAYDLYVRTGRAYNAVNSEYYGEIKKALVEKRGIEWFFLSGGFGIIHALEEAWNYQATFNCSIAYQEGIPYTANIWKTLLPQLCDSAISRLSPDWVYVFGSRDYTRFIKETNVWDENDNIKIIESTGSAGTIWLSKKLAELMYSFFNYELPKFNGSYKKFTKQNALSKGSL